MTSIRLLRADLEFAKNQSDNLIEDIEYRISGIETELHWASGHKADLLIQTSHLLSDTKDVHLHYNRTLQHAIRCLEAKEND